MKANQLSLLSSIILLAAVIASCSKEEVTTFNKLQLQSSNAISSDTIPALAKGTLLENKTYFITSDVLIQKGDTLYAQPGARVIIKNNAQIAVQGVLLLEGSQAEPISFNSDSNTPGSWGGFQCDSAEAITIKWTHVENTGGPDPSGGARKSLYVNKKINVDIEDSWFTNGQDDLIRIQSGATITILRNTITSSGSTDGEAINLKSGVTGVVAYNVIYSQAGTGVKLETSSTAPFPQTIVEVNNNTLVSNGWRRGAAEPGRGISVGVNALAHVFNNLIVNNYQGLEIFNDADLNTDYGNNLFYASIDNFTDNTVSPAISISLKDNFYPADGVGKPQASDLISTSVETLNPSFVSFDGTVAAPNGTANRNNFHLQVGSPALNAGNPKYNNDIGAYTSDDRSNKH